MKFFKSQYQEGIKRFIFRNPDELNVRDVSKAGEKKETLTPDERKKLEGKLKGLEKEQGIDKDKLEKLEEAEGKDKDKDGVEEHKEADAGKRKEEIKITKKRIEERQVKIDQLNQKLGNEKKELKERAGEIMKNGEGRRKLAVNELGKIDPKGVAKEKQLKLEIADKFKKPQNEKKENSGNIQTAAIRTGQRIDGGKTNKV